LFFVIARVFAQTNYPNPYNFVTIGGHANFGYADGTNQFALFAHPYGITIDTNKNLFVTDVQNNVIRKISRAGTNWIASTVAGIRQPSGIAADAAENLYVADGQGSMRKVFASGSNWMVTSVTNYVLFSSSAVAVDAIGNIYVADTAGGNQIHKISPSGTNWLFSTIAGAANGSSGSADGTNQNAKFFGPAGIAVDSTGNLYVADSGNNTIRKMSPTGSNWVVTTIAGLAGHGNEGSSDGTNNFARFYQPEGITIDSSNNLYVCDTENYTIRKIRPSGTNWIVTTIAGQPGTNGYADGTNSGCMFQGPSGITMDGAGTLYIADQNNGTVRSLNAVGTNWVSETISGSAISATNTDGPFGINRFNSPHGIAFDTSGNLYVADYGNQTIREMIPYVSFGQTNWSVVTIAGQPGNFGEVDGTNGYANFSYPSGLAIDTNNVLYVADYSGDAIRKLTPVEVGGQTNWVVSTIAGGTLGTGDGTNRFASFDGPAGMAIDGAGNLYVADSGSSLIRKVSPAGTNWIVTTLAGSAFNYGSVDGTNKGAWFNKPFGIAVDGSGNLLVADNINMTIRRVTRAGTNWVVTTIAGQAGSYQGTDGTNNVARFYEPRGITIDNSGNIFVADTEGDTIREITQSGTNWITTTIAGAFNMSTSVDGIGNFARFYFPVGITTDGAGNIYVADSANNTIRLGSKPLSISPPIAINIQLVGTQMILTWPNPQFSLQYSTNVSGPFATVPGSSSPYTNTFSDQQGFFRLFSN
jgi:sugar lactone lactonase YvrE